MDKDFKFILQPYKGMNSRYTCPYCKKKHQFTRYINRETNDFVANHVGRCNREVNCGYHYTPKEFFEDYPSYKLKNKTDRKIRVTPKKSTTIHPLAKHKMISLIPYRFFEKTLADYDKNNLVTFLINRLGNDLAGEVIGKYCLGSSKHWEGATIFWQIDSKGRIRTGKVMLYNPENGKRVKKPYPHINWIHKIGNFQNFNLKQCLFGEHLLNQYPGKNIAIVESEKTALLASAYVPENIWLASGNLNNLNEYTLKALKGKKILLYPDAGAFHIWKKKALQLNGLAEFTVSDFIERRAARCQIEQGLDIADFLTEKPKKSIGPIEIGQSENTSSNIWMNNQEKMESSKTPDFSTCWNEKEEFLNRWNIDDLETFFKNKSLLNIPIKLDDSSKINNLQTFVDWNLYLVKENNGNPTFKPYFDRLTSVKNILLKGGMG